MNCRLYAIVIVLIVAVGQISCKYNIQKIFEHYNSMLEKHRKPSNQLKISYENCGPSTDPFWVDSLSVTPDPVHIPGVNIQIVPSTNVLVIIQFNIQRI
jgi:hypothetical protein